MAWSHPTLSTLLKGTPPPILFGDLIAIVVMFDAFTKQFKNKSIQIWCDNMAVVSILIRQACCFNRPDIMYFVRILLQICEQNSIKYLINYVPTKSNKADAISRMVKYNEFQSNISNKLYPKPTDISRKLLIYLKKYYQLNNNGINHCNTNCNCPPLTLGGITKPECYFY